MAVHHYRWFLPLVAVVALVSFLLGYIAWPADPLRDRLELVALGMTRSEVENVMGMKPTLVTVWRAGEWGGRRDMDVLTFQGRTGIAEVQIAHDTRRVIQMGWSPSRQESEWLLVWRWFWGG